MPDTHDPLAALAALQRRHDGALPAEARRIAQAGSPAGARLIECAGQACFFREMALGQIAAIRARRKDGSAYAAMIGDLALYRREARIWARRARFWRAALAE